MIRRKRQQDGIVSSQEMPGNSLWRVVQFCVAGDEQIRALVGRVTQGYIFANYVTVQMLDNPRRLSWGAHEQQLIVATINQPMADDVPFDAGEECFATAAGSQSLYIVGAEVIGKRLAVLAGNGDA